jgi:hypothetical protein
VLRAIAARLETRGAHIDTTSAIDAFSSALSTQRPKAGGSRIPMINDTTASVAEFDAFVFSMILAPPMALTRS